MLLQSNTEIKHFAAFSPLDSQLNCNHQTNRAALQSELNSNHQINRAALQVSFKRKALIYLTPQV